MTETTHFDFEDARHWMVYNQVRTWDVLDPRVLDALEQVPRERFVPENWRRSAFADFFVPIGHGESMLTPKLEGRILQALALEPDDHVLEVGTGTGFFAACLARLAGKVLSVDIHEDFTQLARENLQRERLSGIRLETRDSSRLDWTRERFDAIAVTGSMPVLHDSFREALSVGGRLFAVVGNKPIMEGLLITRVGENDWSTESLFDNVLPPLVNAYSPETFEF